MCRNLFQIKFQVLNLQLLPKKKLRHRCFSVNFGNIFNTLFFKCTSERLFLKEQWISLQMAPIAIAINVFNVSYQQELVLFFFLWPAYGKFVEISIKVTFIKVFPVLQFSDNNKCKETAFSRKLPVLFFNSCLMLTIFKLQIISERNVIKQVQCSNGPPVLRLTSQTSQK